jgi:hypothetical protein
MCNNTIVSLSPLNPFSFTFDPSNPEAPYGEGNLTSYGGYTDQVWQLNEQALADEIILGGDPVDLNNQSISNLETDIFQRCAIMCRFRAFNINEDNQYLVIFSLDYKEAGPTAQFFVGDEYVRSEVISGPEQIAFLIDVPPDDTPITVYVRYASQYPIPTREFLVFKSVNVFVI